MTTSFTPFALALALSFNIPGCDGDAAGSADDGRTTSEAPPDQGNGDGGGLGPIDEPIPTVPPQVPQGGTPEPATMLLVAGGALGYVALRRRRRGDATGNDAAS